MEQDKKIEEFVKKINDSKRGQLDLSSDDDLSIAVMNLISIEEHFFFTAEKTGKDEYFDLLAQTREMRKDLLKKLIKEYEGEVWCISKHLLAASMRLMEVGTKQMGIGNKEEAKDLFEKSYELYSLFWALNLKMINVGEIKSIPDDSISVTEEDKKTETIKESGDAESVPVKPNDKKKGFGGFGDIVKRVINCCIE